MLAARNISVELGGRTVLNAISFVVNPGEVLGVVGPNGSGKTTLLRVLAGELQPGSGTVERPAGPAAYLRQGFDGDPATPVSRAFPRAFAVPDPARLAELATAIAETPDPARLDSLSAEYDTLLTALSAATDVPLIPGLRPLDSDAPVGTLSGGELTKLALAGVFAAHATVLLLDEPTNHLDVPAIEWLQGRLSAFPGPVILVSHDRALLDVVATHILEIDHLSGAAETFTGGYSAYADEKARRLAAQEARYRLQQREERQLKQAISAIESRSRSIENRTINFHYRKRAKKVARRAVTLKARLERQLDSAGHVDRPLRAPGGFEGSFASAESAANILVSANQLSLAVAGRTLFDGLSFAVRKGESTVVSGPNGSGKTTLLRAILGLHPVASGELFVAGSANVGFLPQEDPAALDATGDGALTPVEALRRAAPMTGGEASNLLHRFLLGHDQLRTPLHRLSYGERRRLSFAILVLSGANLLLLDEPTNHLDIPSREAFEAALEAYEGAAIVVTHDRYFIDRFADEVIEL